MPPVGRDAPDNSNTKRVIEQQFAPFLASDWLAEKMEKIST
jgi:hypothetical protein